MTEWSAGVPLLRLAEGSMICLHIWTERGYVLCVRYGDDPPMPLYHGPRLDPRYAHPYFPGTVLPYVDAADWSHGHPVPLGGSS